jgi:ribosome-binding factor A
VSRRSERVSSLIRHELGTIFQQDLKDPRIEGLVSITMVDVSPDLRVARVFLSVYGSEEAEQHALAALSSAKAFLRHELGRRLRLRYAPELDLRIDHSLAHADKVAAILRNLPPPATD